MKGNMKFFGLLLGTVIVISGIFGACENPMYPDPAKKGSAGNNSNSGGNNNNIAVDAWDPVMVIILKTTDGRIGTLSFMPREGEGSPASSDGTYNYRLHVTGDIFSRGTVVVSNNDTTFSFTSEGEKTFGASVSGRDFEFNTTYITGDDEDEEKMLSFLKAAIPSVDEPVIPAQSISLTHNAIPLYIDGTATLTAAILPANADTQVWWTTNKPAVVKIEPLGTDGLSVKITALKSGTAAIRVKTVTGGKIAECTVTVKKLLVPGLFLEEYGEESDLLLGPPDTGSLLAAAFTWIKDSGTAGGKYIIVLDEDETESSSAGYTIGTGPASSSTGIKINLKITLKGVDAGATITKTATGALFTVYGANASDVPELVLGENITLKGYSGNNKPVVIVGSTNYKGNLTMKIGSRITGNTTSAASAGGVQVTANGTFIMEGGSIDGNTVTANAGAGGGVVNSGIFEMKGGVIENNTAGNSATGTTPQGGGVLAGSGMFTMTGGAIRNNRVLSSQTSPTTQQGGMGGGVSARYFTMDMGTDAAGNTTVPVIEGNTASRGGGISNYANNLGTITIAGGIIRNNHATFENTGSAFERHNGANIQFIKTGGTIYGINAGADSNCAENDVGQGYAIVLRTGNYATAIAYYRNDTAGESVSLDSSSTGEGSGWSTP
jgi:hypothetical protein